MLRGRVRWDLQQGAVAGDARLAIGILRPAAGKADRENSERITDERLQQAAVDARAQIRQKSRDSLMPHQRVDEPRTKWTIRTYLSKQKKPVEIVNTRSSLTEHRRRQPEIVGFRPETV